MLLLDGDIAFAPQVLDRVLDDAHPNRLALRTQGDLGDEEMKVRLDRDGRVIDIAKTIPPAEAAGESMGIEVFSPAFTAKLFAAIERRVRSGAGRDEFYEAAFVELIRGGEAVFPVDLGDLACLEIDTPADLEHARGIFGAPS